MAKRLQAFTPKGKPILGTLEKMEARADIVRGSWKRTRKGLVFEHSGYTEVFWESQETAKNRRGKTLFLDEDGNEWPEDKLILKEVA